MGLIDSIKNTFSNIFGKEEKEELVQVDYSPSNDVVSPYYDLGINTQKDINFDIKIPSGISPNITFGDFDIDKMSAEDILEINKPTLRTIESGYTDTDLESQIKEEQEEKLAELSEELKSETQKKQEVEQGIVEGIKEKESERQQLIKKYEKLGIEVPSVGSHIWHSFLGSLTGSLESTGTGFKIIGQKAERNIEEQEIKNVFDIWKNRYNFTSMGIGKIGENMEQYYGDVSDVQQMKQIPDELLGVGGQVGGNVASVVGSAIPSITTEIGTGGTGVVAQAYAEGSGDLYSTAEQIYAEQLGKNVEDLTNEEKDLLFKASSEAGVFVAGSTWVANKIGLSKTLAPFKRKLITESIEKAVKESEEKIITKATQESLTKSFTKGYIKSVGSETIEEVSQEAAKNIILDVNEIDPDRKISENLLQTAVQTAIGVGLSFGLLEGFQTSIETNIENKRKALSATPEKVLNITEDEGDIVAVEDTENSEVILKEVDPKVFEKDDTLDKNFVETKISDITLKLADIVGGKDAREYQNEFDSQEFNSYKEFVEKSTKKVSEIIGTKESLKSVSEQMASVIIGNSDKVNVVKTNKLIEPKVNINLSNDLLHKESDNVPEITSQRFTNPVATSISRTIGSTASQKMTKPSKSELPTQEPNITKLEKETFNKEYVGLSKQEKSMAIKPEHLSVARLDKVDDIQYEAQKTIAAAKTAYDKLTVETPRQLSLESSSLAINKIKQDVEAESQKKLTKKDILLMRAEIKTIKDRINSITEDSDKILGTRVLQMRGIQESLNGNFDGAPQWYIKFYSKNNRNANEQELINLAEEEIKRRVKDESMTTSGENELDVRYLSLQSSLDVYETILETYEKLLNAKDNRVIRYINLSDALEEIKKTESKLKNIANENQEIISLKSELKVNRDLQPEELTLSFKNLTTKEKTIYNRGTEVFVDYFKDPYIIKVKKINNKTKSVSTTYKLIDGSKVDNYNKSDIKYRLSTKAEQQGFKNVSEYFTSIVEENKSNERLEIFIDKRYKEILQTPEYQELLKRKQSIVDRMEMIEKSYPDSKSLVKAVRFKQYQAMRDITNKLTVEKVRKEKDKLRRQKNKRISEIKNISKEKLAYERKKAREKINEIYNDEYIKTKKRKAIFNNYIREFTENNSRSVAVNMVNGFKRKHSGKLSRELNWQTMSDSKFEQLMSNEFDPILERHSEIMMYITGINDLITSRQLSNVSDLEKSAGFPKVYEKKFITSRDLETMKLKDLDLYLDLLNKFEHGSEFLPSSVLNRQLKKWKNDENNLITDADIFWTEKDFIEYVADKNKVSLKTATKQLEKIRSKGYSMLDKLTGIGNLNNVKDVYTNVLVGLVSGMSSDAKSMHTKLRNEANKRLRVARKSRRRTTDLSVDKKIGTDAIIKRFLDADLNKKQELFSQMTEVEQDFALWIKDEFFGKLGEQLTRTSGMLRKQDYVSLINKSMSEYLSEGGLNIFKSMKRYFTDRNLISEREQYENYAKNGKFLSSEDHFVFAKERTGYLEAKVFEKVFDQQKERLNKLNKNKLLEEASSLEIDTAGIKKSIIINNIARNLAESESSLRKGSENLGRIINLYAPDAAQHIVFSEQLPRITSMIEIIKLDAKEGNNINNFWEKRLEVERGIEQTLFMDPNKTSAKTIGWVHDKLSWFFTVKYVGFKFIRQFLNVGGAFTMAGSQVGYIPMTRALAKLTVSKSGLSSIIGTKSSKQQLNNVNRILDEHIKPVLNDGPTEMLLRTDRTLWKRFSEDINFIGYSVAKASIDLAHATALLKEEEINSGILTKERRDEIMLKMGQVTDLDVVSGSPIGSTMTAQALNKWLSWAMKNVFHTVGIVRQSGLKISDQFRKIENKKYENIKSKDIVEGWAFITRSALTVTVVTQITQALLKSGYLPEDQEEDDFMQSSIRRLLQDMNSGAGSFLSLANRYQNLINDTINLTLRLKDGDGPFEFTDKRRENEMQEFLALFGQQQIDSKTNIFVVEETWNALAGIFGNYIKTQSTNYNDEEKRKADKDLKYNLYKQVPTIAKQTASLFGAVPGFFTASKENRKVSRELLGHPYGFDEGSAEARAYEIFKTHEGASSSTIARDINKYLNSERKEDQRVGIALQKMHGSKFFSQEETEFLFELMQNKLVRDTQYNTNGTRGMALAMYLNTLESDKERADFLSRLSKRHVSYGLIDEDVIKKAKYFYDNKMMFNKRESKFYEIYSGEKRANAIVNYLFELDLSETEMKKQLNVYLKAGMINKDTSQEIISKMKERGIKLNDPNQ